MPDQYKLEIPASDHAYLLGIAPSLTGLNFISGIYQDAMGNLVFAVICDDNSYALTAALLLNAGVAVKI